VDGALEPAELVARDVAELEEHARHGVGALLRLRFGFLPLGAREELLREPDLAEQLLAIDGHGYAEIRSSRACSTSERTRLRTPDSPPAAMRTSVPSSSLPLISTVTAVSAIEIEAWKEEPPLPPESKMLCGAGRVIWGFCPESAPFLR